MKYTQYFAQLVKQHGMLNLPQDEIIIFLNIIHLEANLEVYLAWNSDKKYNRNIDTINQKLNELTGKLTPQDLIEKWINGEPTNIRAPKKEYKTWDDHEEQRFTNASQYRKQY